MTHRERPGGHGSPSLGHWRERVEVMVPAALTTGESGGPFSDTIHHFLIMKYGGPFSTVSLYKLRVLPVSACKSHLATVACKLN